MESEDIKSRLIALKVLATEAKNYSLAVELSKIEKELDQKFMTVRTQGIMVGFGLSMACLVAGGIATNIIVITKTE